MAEETATTATEAVSKEAGTPPAAPPNVEEILATIREVGTQEAAKKYNLTPDTLRRYVRRVGKGNELALAVTEWRAKVARERFKGPRPTPWERAKPKPESPKPETPRPKPIKEGQEGSLTAEVKKERPKPVVTTTEKKEEKGKEGGSKKGWGLPSWGWWAISGVALLLLGLWLWQRFRRGGGGGGGRGPGLVPPVPSSPMAVMPQPPVEGPPPTPSKPSEEDIVRYWKEQFGM